MPANFGTTTWPPPSPNTMADLVRFHPRFLAFAREYRLLPACLSTPASGLGERKSGTGGIGYLRQNFWPLRSFTDLAT